MSYGIKVHFKHVEVYSEVDHVQCVLDNNDLYLEEAVVKIAQYYIGEEANEVMLSIMLNAEMQLIGTHRFSVGGISEVLLPIAECFKSALANKASYIYLAHVHPAGASKQSTYDVKSTRNVMSAGKVIGIPVLGHVIVTHDKNEYQWIDIEDAMSSKEMEKIKPTEQLL